MNYDSQPELLSALISIFPEFEAEWLADIEGESFPSVSLHSVYQSFLPFVSTAAATPKQLAKLAEYINGAVNAGGNAENAVSTCFLEHAGQVGIAKSLKPLLSKESRSRLNA